MQDHKSGRQQDYVEQEQEGSEVEDETLTAVDNVKVVKAKKNEAGDAIENGLKAEIFTKIDAEKGVRALVITDDSKKITEIRVFAGKKKGPSDIVDTAIGAGKFKTLVTAIKAAELVDTLKGKGPFTVFGPRTRLCEGSQGETRSPAEGQEARPGDVLTYHVVPGKVMAADVVKLDSAKTVQGQSITIVAKDGKVTVNGANVLKTDIVCSNGVIHVIDAVLLPPKK